MTKARQTQKAGMAGLLLLIAAAVTATATHVDPELIEGPDNFTCADFEPADADWNELKVDPLASGVHSDDDGALIVTIVADGTTSFNWTSNLGVSAVFVKDGSHGSHLYEYDPPALADTGLTAAPHKDKGTTIDNISHVSFCYEELDDVPSDGNETEPPDGNETLPPPVLDECPPGSLSATAHGDSSISVVAMDLEQDATLMRSDGGEFATVASLDAVNDTYVDTDTEVGVTYTYQLVIDGDVCDMIEVTAIPVFPGLVAAGLATGLGLLGYVGLRRRS